MANRNRRDWASRPIGRRGAIRTLGGAGLLIAGVGCTTPAATTTPTAGPAAPGTAAPTAARGAAAPAATTAAQPKRGGAFRWSNTSNITHNDPHQTTNSWTFGFGIGVAWSRLLKYKLAGV